MYIIYKFNYFCAIITYKSTNYYINKQKKWDVSLIWIGWC